MKRLFISYRRDDSQHQADRLHAHLKRAVQDPDEQIFIDIDHIPLGVDFYEHLDSQVAQCDVLLALIGPDWLDARDPTTNTRRLDDPADFVRIEIASALKRGIPVVPVLLDGVQPLRAADLPEDLRPLARRQAVEVRRASFDADAERLLRRLGLDSGEEPPPPRRRKKAAPVGGMPAWALPVAGIGLVVIVGAALALWLDPFGPGERSAGPSDPTEGARMALPADEIDRISKAVVRIVALEDGEPAGVGSGTLVSATGLIHTNHHVVEGGDDFKIELLDDPNELPVAKYRARVTGSSENADFAVLQIDRDAAGSTIDAESLDLPFLAEDATSVRRGESVYVFGYPAIEAGYQSYTEGNITTIRADTFAGRRMDVWYQTDAQISPGSSGGLVVNARSQIVGMPTAVQTEDTTGGRIARILSIGAIRAAIDTDFAEPEVVTDTMLGVDEEPSFGAVALNAGFPTDPYRLDMTSGGPVDVAYLDDSKCSGFASVAPSFRMQWSGTTTGLRMFFLASDGAHDGDTTLLIKQPDGTWLCNDDAADGAGDPLVVLANPAQGRYQVWVGSYRQGREINGTLYVTEYNHTPASMAPTELDVSRGAYQTITIEPGFESPHLAEITVGGAIDASYLGTECVGFTTVMADVRLNWSGRTERLVISFAKDTRNTTLVVHRPDGSWLCNDDESTETHDPRIEIENPSDGTYSIWVGAKKQRRLVSGTLSLSE